MGEELQSADQRPRRTFTYAMWAALVAAFLGWMFDGLEMGLYSIAVPAALADLCQTSDPKVISALLSLTLGLFLLGMSAGGIIFGRLGDRIGRVRALIFTVLIYAVFTGLSGLSRTWQELALFRFLGAVGLGGEWGLGVALVMETWPNASRPVLAGVLGAAANFGFLASSGIGFLRAQYDWSWRIVLISGALPAVLTVFVRLCVREPERWRRARERGEIAPFFAGERSSKLLGLSIGAAIALGYWLVNRINLLNSAPQLLGEGNVAVQAALLTMYMVVGGLVGAMAGAGGLWGPELRRRTFLGAALAAIAVLGLWGSLQAWLQAWVRDVTPPELVKDAVARTTMWMSLGAIVGSLLGGPIGEWLGRRVSFALLCLASMGLALVLYTTCTPYPMNARFLALVCLVFIPTIAFFGWLPLYLPELFPTRLRTTGEGFTFNAARVVSAYGIFGTPALIKLFGGSYPRAAATMSLIYAVGLIVIWFCPELKGKELPD